MAGGLQAGDARIAAVAEPAGLGEFRGGALDPAFEAIGGGEAAVRPRMSAVGGARLFEPGDRLVGAPFQQMPIPDPVVPDADVRIAGAEEYRALLQSNRLGDRSGPDPAAGVWAGWEVGWC